ncbi:MAG: HAMP domain-containing sensor histidine kinase [Patescibacteria group bacterium]
MIFSSNIPTLHYYSHLVAILAAVVFAFALIGRFRESSTVRWLFVTIFLFSIWTAIDTLLWASNRPDLVLFLWNTQILLEALFYASAFCLSYAFITNKDPGAINVSLLAVLVLPIIAVIPTGHALEGIDIAYCNALETPFIIFYTYAVQILIALSILFLTFRESARSQGRALPIQLFAAGMIIFLIAFSSGNIIGSITDDWELAQAGLLGMPIFIGFLAYTTVRFRTFNVKILGAQALVVSLWLVTFFQLFVRSVENMRLIIGVNLVLFSIIGYFLIKGVRREVQQRERIQVLAADLEKANKQQVTLIHFITHQIKGFVTKSRNIFSLMREGDLGPIPEAMKPMIEEGFRSDTKGVTTIQEILNAANIKSGKVTYSKEPFDLKALIDEILQDLKAAADAKGLVLQTNTGDTPLMYPGDKAQLTNALKNLIDNSIKYTMQGEVRVTLAQEAGKARFTVEDTGVGITPEDMAHLFTEGGHGANSAKINVESTGFGLYIVKNIVEAHNGKVWAESDGEGKGSRFIVELPV